MTDGLISPEYLELQRDLHRTAGNYGHIGARYINEITDVIEKCAATSVLDYGCGMGLLKTALGDMSDMVREYDPAIAGKDSPPEAADVVVCTDVLEHIEPDKLDAVLDHIRGLARKAVFISVATRPAIRSLADGRNAHLIIEPPEWWRNKLSIFFEIKDWSSWPDLGLIMVALPYRTMGDIIPVGVMSDDDRFAHVKQNVAATDKRVKISGPHNRVAILLCYGPSLQDAGDVLNERDTIEIADVVSVSGAHDFVVGRGLVPRFHIECDPRRHKGDMISTPHPDIEYLMASCVHPEVIAKLAGYNLRLWHLDNGESAHRIPREVEPNALLIGGGGSVGLRAIPLLMAMGYRRFIVHGMDCSYRGDGTHAGPHTGKPTKKIDVVCKGRRFVTAPVLLAYLKQFDDTIRPHCGNPDVNPHKIEIILRGDGLLQHALLTSGGAEPGPLANQNAA